MSPALYGEIVTYNCKYLHNRYEVEWDSIGNMESACDDASKDLISAWEMFSVVPDVIERKVPGPLSVFREEVLPMCLSLLKKLMLNPKYQKFIEIPPDNNTQASSMMKYYNYLNEGRDLCRGHKRRVFVNAKVPLPMCLSVIKERMDQGYYRNLQAILNDIELIDANADMFFGSKKSSISYSYNKTNQVLQQYIKLLENRKITSGRSLFY